MTVPMVTITVYAILMEVAETTVMDVIVTKEGLILKTKPICDRSMPLKKDIPANFPAPPDNTIVKCPSVVCVGNAFPVNATAVKPLTDDST